MTNSHKKRTKNILNIVKARNMMNKTKKRNGWERKRRKRLS